MRYRVLILPEWYPWPEQPGFGVFYREQAELVSRRHDVVLFTWRPDSSLGRPYTLSEATEGGVRTFRLRFRPSGTMKLSSACKLVGMVAVMLQLRREGWRPDIVHADQYSVGRLAQVPARLAKAPIVVSENWSAFVSGEVEPREMARARRAFRRAAVISPVSRDLAGRIAPLASCTPVVIVPNPVDTEAFMPRERDTPGAATLITVGALIERKGHRYLFEALAALRGSGITPALRIIGDGPRRQDLEKLAERLGIRDQVRFSGYMSKSDIAKALREAHIFVFPSLAENLPCALLEAMASGLPAVATRVGGIPEIIDDRGGLVVEPGSATALAAALDELLATHREYRPRDLHQLAANRYGHESVAEQWTAVYDKARGLRSPGALAGVGS
jgi:glycosyltransferase involved in cell wall biosynthesis